MKLSKPGIAWLLFLAACFGAATTAGVITHEWNTVFVFYGLIALVLLMTWACTFQMEIGEALRFARIGWKVMRVPYRERSQFVLDQTRLPLPGSW